MKFDHLDLFKVPLPDIYESPTEAKNELMNNGSIENQFKTHWDEIAKYSKEFLSYDFYLISSPMWNFSVPYKLKHYIDVIMQAGILFSFTDRGPVGLALNKKMFCITSSGSDYSKSGPINHFDFQEIYLRSIVGMVGITDISFIHAQPLDLAPGITQIQLNIAKEEAKTLAQNSSNSNTFKITA